MKNKNYTIGIYNVPEKYRYIYKYEYDIICNKFVVTQYDSVYISGEYVYYKIPYNTLLSLYRYK